MGHKFTEIAFTPQVKAVQELNGSRRAYSRLEAGDTHHDILGEGEAAFISARDSFYMASVSETGWPYVQHRGGPAGFLRVLDEKTLGFADYRGNRQYISVGNFVTDNRVSIFLMDYPNRARLKILGRAQLVEPSDLETLTKLRMPEYKVRVERGITIAIDAFDWNCSQHITPRFTPPEIEEKTAELRQKLIKLESEFHGKVHGASEG